MERETRDSLPALTVLMVAFGLSFLSLLTGCVHRPQSVTVVAPSGPATQAQDSAITDHLARLDAALSQTGAAFSRVSASAGAIQTINAGQPAGARTTGVTGEASLIQAVAGQPTEADRMEASERARIVAEGKAEDIAKQYASAQTAALQAQKALGDTQLALTASNAALVKAKADAQIEQAKATTALQARIDAIQKQANDQVKAAQDKASAESRKLITWIFFGGGALLFAGGLAILFFASSIPMFGPKAGVAVSAAGAGLIFIGMVLNELAKHPWILWTGISLCIASAAVAVGLIISNNGTAVEAAKAEAAKLLAEAKAKLTT